MRVPLSVSFLLVYAAIVWCRLKAHSGRQWRRSVLEAALLLGAGTIAGTELLGLVHLVHPTWVSLVWALAGAVSLFYLWHELRKPGPPRSRLVARVSGLSVARLLGYWHPLELLVLCLALGATGIIAWRAPPNNFDSMTYQLSRVMHWFQQGTLGHYPTSNIRQLAYGPGAAYWQVQLMAVFNGDLAANLPQWAALVGGLIALTLWLERLVDRRAIGFSVIIGLTLPMALLQACSTQTDLQVGCWLLVAAAFLSETRPEKLARAGFVGLAIGLAVVTKPSALLCAAPLSVVAFWRTIRSDGFGAALRIGLVWVTISVAVCLPHFVRNARWFGNPLGSDDGTVVECLSPRLVAANAARWTALNIPVLSVWQGMGRALESAGIDANDAAITFRHSKFTPAVPYVVYRLLLPDEDLACYTSALLLIGLLALIMRIVPRAPVDRSSPRRQPLWPWLAAIGVSLALHFTLLKWQFWGNRLLLPLTLLAFPLLAALTGAWRHRLLRTVVVSLLLAQTAFVLLFSLNRPLVPLPAAWNFTGATPLFGNSRTNHFYTGYNAEAVPVCHQLVDFVRRTQRRRIGLIVDENYPEYVIWRSLADAGLKGVELYHLNAKLPTGYHGVAWPPPVDFTINVSTPGKP